MDRTAWGLFAMGLLACQGPATPQPPPVVVAPRAVDAGPAPVPSEPVLPWSAPKACGIAAREARTLGEIWAAPAPVHPLDRPPAARPGTRARPTREVKAFTASAPRDPPPRIAVDISPLDCWPAVVLAELSGPPRGAFELWLSERLRARARMATAHESEQALDACKQASCAQAAPLQRSRDDAVAQAALARQRMEAARGALVQRLAAAPPDDPAAAPRSRSRR